MLIAEALIVDSWWKSSKVALSERITSTGPMIRAFPLCIRPQLLIVDDDEEIRAQMKWALAHDYEVLLAGDQEEALETFTSHRPAVILLDLGLPPRPRAPVPQS